MTKFLDGPAKGQTLLLRGAPAFLRVTELAGKWDALDQWEDEPKDGETLFAYERIGEAGACHINFGRGRGGFYAVADYRFVADQPMQSLLKDPERWRAWCKLKLA